MKIFKTKEERIHSLDLIGRHFETYRNLMLVLCSFLLLISLAFCIYWHFDEYSLGDRIDYLYLTCHLVFLATSLISIVMLILNKFKKIPRIALAIFFHVEVFVFLTFSCLLSILDLKIGLSPISYLLASVVSAGVFVVEPIFFSVLSFGYYIVIMMFQLINKYPYFSNQNMLENIIYFIAFGLLIVLVAFRHFKVTKTEYISKDKLEKMSYIDELTGLLNERSYVNETVSINEDIVKDRIEPFGVILMDVNNLKATNDKYGHRYGCHLVVLTGETLPTIFKTSKCFHVGGDEFIVILRGEDLSNFKETIKRFDDACRYSMIDFEGVKLIFSVARGYSFYQKGDRFQDVLQRADGLMYSDKKGLKEKYNMQGR